MRLFVAIELSREWLAALEAAQSALKAALERRGAPRLRWVRPEGIHLTLKFLGEVPESRLQSVTEALEFATNPPPDFVLRMVRVGSFGDRRGPRVVWVGVDGQEVADREHLYRLVERLETRLAAAGFPRDRRFSPHLTLARVPETISNDERSLLAEVTAALPEPRTPPLAVSRISLIRSHIQPGGARYETIARFPA